MFGFGNKRVKAIDEAERYMRSMFAGLLEVDDELPDQVFADPYVVGFLQVLTTHAVAAIYRFELQTTRRWPISWENAQIGWHLDAERLLAKRSTNPVPRHIFCTRRLKPIELDDLPRTFPTAHSGE